MANYQILTSETGSADSLSFRINLGDKDPKNLDKAYLGIYGTIGTAVITLNWKAPDNNYYTTGDVISGLGLVELPFSSKIILRLSVVAGGSSSISAVIFNGIPE